MNIDDIHSAFFSQVQIRSEKLSAKAMCIGRIG